MVTQYGLYKAVYDDEQGGFISWRIDYVFDNIPNDNDLKQAFRELDCAVNIRTCRVLLRDGIVDTLGYKLEKIDVGIQ